MVSRRGWHRGVISRIGFYYRIEMVKSSGFQEIWYKGDVSMRRKVKRSGFYVRMIQREVSKRRMVSMGRIVQRGGF